MNRKCGLFYLCSVLLLLALGTLDLFSLKHYYSRPERVRSLLQERLGENFSFERYEYDVFKGISFQSFRLFSSPRKSPEDVFFKTSRVHVSFSIFDILKGRSSPTNISIHKPELVLEQNEQDRMNVFSFLEGLPSVQTEGAQVLDTNISVHDGTIQMKNLPFLLEKHRRIELRDVAVDIRPIREGTGLVFDGAGMDPKLGEVTVSGRFVSGKLFLEVVCRHLEVKKDLVHIFSPQLREKWQRYQLTGPATLRYQLEHSEADTKDGSGRTTQKLVVQPEGMNAAFTEFPYPLSNIQGTVQFQPERIRFGLQGTNNGSRFWINGTSEGYEEDSALNVAIHAENTPIDESLYQALEPHPDVESFVRSLNLSGTLNADGYVSRQQGQEKVDYSIRIHPRGIKGKFSDFPYPVKDVRGTVLIEPDRVQIEQLTGVPGISGEVPQTAEAQFHGTIRLNEIEDSEELPYNFSISAREIPLESTLKSNLPSDVQETWEKLNPEGTGSIQWSISHEAPFTTTEHTVKASFEKCTLQPEPLSFPVQDVSANVTYQNDRIELSNVSGQWNEGTVQVKQGRILTGDTAGEPAALFKISGENLSINQPLQELILSDPDLLKTVKDKGKVDLNGQVRWFAGRDDQELDFSIVADVEDMHLEKKLDLSDIRGKIILKGEREQAESSTHRILSGGVNLSNMSINGFTVKSFQSNFLIRDGILDFYDLSGQTTGGSLKAGQIHYNTGTSSFDVNLQASDLSLQDLLSNLDVKEKNLSGNLSGHITLRGKTDERKSWKGNGEVHLQDAQLWKLPLFLPIFMKLSLSKQEPFNSGRIRFDVENENVEIRRMRFESSSSRLLGIGRVGFDGNLLINLKTEELDPIIPPIPIIGWIYNLITENLVTFQATGTIQEPSVSVTPLPFLFEEKFD